MRLWQTNPLEAITLVRGEGCRVIDAAGRVYLDMLAGTWCNILGYGHRAWVEAVHDQARTLTHVGSSFASSEIDRALAKLGEVLPAELDRVVFLNTGSEAVELALKMARAATGAEGLVVFERGYYGATTYALSLSEAGRAAAYLPKADHVDRLPAPTCARCPVGRSWPCVDYPCLALPEGPGQADGNRIAAVLWEPVMAVGGMIVPPPGHGARLRELASRCGALLIAEEVTTGMGRTGRWFAFEHDDLVPDILVIGKALGAGLPVAAVVTSRQVEACCAGLLRHVQSHQNDPFSGRIAATVISIIQQEGLVQRAARQGEELLNRLRDLQSRCPQIQDVRGRGLMIGIELEADHAADGTRAARRLLEDGVIVDYRPADATFRLFPPYVISSEEIDAFLNAFERAIVDRGGGAPAERSP
jgi:2,2-dialkylglycine decarboxylase (pyruvate)